MTTRIALFVPCFIDQLYPPAAIATLRLLESYQLDVSFPTAQVCCGQPLINAGASEIATFANRFEQTFADFDAIVCPSASCVATVRHLYGQLGHHTATCDRTYELCEFLHDIQQVQHLPGRCQHRVAVHPSCHGLRELRLGPASELTAPFCPQPPDRVRALLAHMNLTPVPVQRPDECCGFGGMFSIHEETVSCLSGLARLDAFLAAGADIVTATDWSCLMHLQALAQRNQYNLRFHHIAELLVGDLA